MFVYSTWIDFWTRLIILLLSRDEYSVGFTVSLSTTVHNIRNKGMWFRWEEMFKSMGRCFAKGSTFSHLISAIIPTVTAKFTPHATSSKIRMASGGLNWPVHRLNSVKFRNKSYSGWIREIPWLHPSYRFDDCPSKKSGNSALLNSMSQCIPDWDFEWMV